MKKQVFIGTRGSRLAMIQAQSVLSKLTGLYPDLDFRIDKIATTGDRRKTSPIGKIPGFGIFVKELQIKLLQGKIDLAVHSLKDLPLQSPPGLCVAAVTKRVDARDVLVSRGKKLIELSSNSVIGTGSLRRRSQILAFRPDLKVKEIRGNIDTRLKKVFSEEVDGIVVAAAGLIRMGWEDKITEFLPDKHFLPEPGQGALAIEIKADDRDIWDIVRPMNHELTWQCVAAERAFALTMGGGCSTPVACLGTMKGKKLRLQGMAAGPEGLLFASEEGEGDFQDLVAQRLADRLIELGAIQNHL